MVNAHIYFLIFSSLRYEKVGQDSVVSIVTWYRMDGLWIEF